MQLVWRMRQRCVLAKSELLQTGLISRHTIVRALNGPENTISLRLSHYETIVELFSTMKVALYLMLSKCQSSWESRKETILNLIEIWRCIGLPRCIIIVFNCDGAWLRRLLHALCVFKRSIRTKGVYSRKWTQAVSGARKILVDQRAGWERDIATLTVV
jgi:hypothetical protein